MTALSPAAPGVSYEARVAPYKGRNVIWVNGRPLAPLMYSGTEHSRETWAGRPRQSIEEFSHLGYEIIQSDLWFKYSLRPAGAFDMAGVRRQLAGILEVNPEAKIVMRINVSAPPLVTGAEPGGALPGIPLPGRQRGAAW